MARVHFWLCACECVCAFWRLLTPAFSKVRKTPVDSTTYSAPASPQGISVGFMLDSEAKDEFQQNWGGRNISVAVAVARKRDRNIPLINTDGVAVDHQFVILSTDFTLETAVSGIISKHVGLKRSEDDRFRISWSFQCNQITFLFGNLILRADSLIIWI